ncbi:MAG: S1C family serine protease, partial [Planctomycetota bacterium]
SAVAQPPSSSFGSSPSGNSAAVNRSSPGSSSGTAVGSATAGERERERQFEQLSADVAHLEQEGRLLRRVVSFVKPTVVHIDAERADEPPRPGRRPTEETGSGIVVELAEAPEQPKKFFVLTNRHVVKNSPLNRIRIKLTDGRVLTPTKIWSDKASDVAVLAVQAPNLVPAKLGDSDQMDIGDFVLAVGSPFGLSHSVSYGIISAKGRRDLQLGSEAVSYQDFLQTDAAVNPGNSGGPLINLRGEVVGLNTGIASSSGGNDGIAFAIPINMVVAVARQLVEQGVVVRAYLGVHLDVRFGEEAARRQGVPQPGGARVTQVTPKSPAAEAKLLPGDVILEFDQVHIEDDNHLVNRVSLTPVGKKVTVVVFRDGQTLRLPVTVTERERFEGPER